VRILEGLRERYEQHHRVTINDDALAAAAELADRYISDRFLPDKAIDLIDEAASRMRIKSMSAPLSTVTSRRNRNHAREEGGCDRGSGVRKAASLRDTERQLTTRKRQLEDEWGRGRERRSDRSSARRRSPTSSRCGRNPGLQADRG